MTLQPYVPDQPLFAIGDITVTQHSVIVPQGRYPIARTTWTVQDSTQVTYQVSTAGVILTIIFVWFCLLGLLFLLMKEQRVTGFVVVSVTGPGFYHQTMLPPGPASAAWASHMVAQARGIAANA